MTNQAYLTLQSDGGVARPIITGLSAHNTSYASADAAVGALRPGTIDLAPKISLTVDVAAIARALVPTVSEAATAGAGGFALALVPSPLAPGTCEGQGCGGARMVVVTGPGRRPGLRRPLRAPAQGTLQLSDQVIGPQTRLPITLAKSPPHPIHKGYAQSGSGGAFTAKGEPAKWAAWETVDGVQVRVIFEPATGKILTAFPDAEGPPVTLKKVQK